MYFFNYINSLKDYCSESNKEINYDEIDRLLWLFGKINKGTVAILIGKNKYQEFYNNIKSQYCTECKKDLNKEYSAGIDKVISNYMLKAADRKFDDGNKKSDEKDEYLENLAKIIEEAGLYEFIEKIRPLIDIKTKEKSINCNMK